MGEAVHAIVTVQAAEGRANELQALLTAMAEKAREQPGCERFDLMIDDSTPGRFVMVEVWEDQSALQGHGDSDYVGVAAARGRAKHLLSELPEVHLCRRLG